MPHNWLAPSLLNDGGRIMVASMAAKHQIKVQWSAACQFFVLWMKADLNFPVSSLPVQRSQEKAKVDSREPVAYKFRRY